MRMEAAMRMEATRSNLWRRRDRTDGGDAIEPMEATRSNRWRRRDRTRTTIVGGTDPRRQCAGEGRQRRGYEGEGGWSEESEEEESSERQRG
ncbi:hypothetical protein U1Q18_023505 [Sarracenia purpurea var. burkii]